MEEMAGMRSAQVPVMPQSANLYAQTDAKYMSDPNAFSMLTSAHLPPNLPPHNFNHPFSINNLMSQHEAAKLYPPFPPMSQADAHLLKHEHDKFYSHPDMTSHYYAPLPPPLHPSSLVAHKDEASHPATSSPVTSVEQGGYYRSYTPQSTSGL